MLHDVRGIKYNIVEEGTGHPVIFLHGLGGSWRDWAPQLDTLSDRYRCVVVEHRGHGRTERTDGAYSIELFAEDVVAALGGLGIDHAYVVGLSMGGIIAQVLALECPELVDAVVLANTIARSDPARAGMVSPAIEAIRTDGVGAMIGMMDTAAWSETTRLTRPEVVRDFQREAANNDPESFAKSLRAVARADYTERLGGLKAPAMVIWGEHDGLVSREATDELVRALGSPELVIIPDTAHITNVEDTAAFNEALCRHFDTNPCHRTL